ncbi:hypothetical protein H0H87_010005 [Tephrocybe sp. NHM501043]|nr:hypothetical protein H0H87_010005 [Tephrocybe sp. NHM501043]
MLQVLFPAPSSSRSELAPRTWPGITPQSTATIQNIVKDSQERWHLFFDRDYRPHNHSVHYTLALWALGADDEIIKAAYEIECEYLIPRFKSPGSITTENFNEHLGDDEYYSSYLDFFTEIVKKQGTSEALEEYIFSQKANFMDGKEDKEQPGMLDRCMDGIIHSMIHIGNGLEFGVPALVAEGLAWTAVHFKSSTAVISASLWNASPTALDTTTSENPQHVNTHALTILARILKDPRFDDIPAAEDYSVVYANINDKYGDVVSEYVRTWTFDQKNPQEAERKIEELIFANTVIYAIGGWSKDKAFNTDFFQCVILSCSIQNNSLIKDECSVHLVTSSLFLAPFCAILKPVSQELFLRSFFAVGLTWWIGRGRPGFDIEGFVAGTSTNPGPVPSFPPAHRDALPKPSSPLSRNPNPWFQLVQDALTVPDEHFPKAIRALAHFSEIYGGRKAGQEDFGNIELPGADLIDGTLFVRAAVLNNSKLRDDQNVGLRMTAYWDRQGFYRDALPASSGLPANVVSKMQNERKEDEGRP